MNMNNLHLWDWDGLGQILAHIIFRPCPCCRCRISGLYFITSWGWPWSLTPKMRKSPIKYHHNTIQRIQYDYIYPILSYPMYIIVDSIVTYIRSLDVLKQDTPKKTTSPAASSFRWSSVLLQPWRFSRAVPRAVDLWMPSVRTKAAKAAASEPIENLRSLFLACAIECNPISRTYWNQ